MPSCPSCDAEVLDIDVKCKSCGAALGSTGAHRMVGSTVLGQYRIEDVLGQGGMSVVFRARHTMTEQEVALKVLPPDLAAYSQVKSRFLDEAKALAQLDHPNIVHLYNFGQENGSFVLAMQFVQGETWERLILEGGRQDWPTAVHIAIDVLRALEYAHGRGVIHRDMKPSNVLVREDDGTATVMDFGIAKMTTSTRLTATGQTMGTVRYMSPEQVRGQEVDARSDIYSLGATLYEAVTGDTPFDGNTHFEIMSKHLSEPVVAPSKRGVEIPAALEAAIMTALAKKASDRFDSARDMRKALELVVKEADVGFAETLRMSRDVVARARLPKATRPMGASPAASSGSPSPNAGSPRPPAAAASDATTRPLDDGRLSGLADRLEPGDEPGPRRRTALWLGLGLLVLAAGGAVATLLFLNRGTSRASRPDASPPVVKEFQPTGVTWKASSDVPADRIVVRVAAPIDWPPDEVARVYHLVKDAVPGVLAGKSAAKYPARLAVQVVPRAVLCDPRTFEGSQPEDCHALGTYFRVSDSTLLVADDRPLLAANLAQAVAEIVCVYNDLDPCFAPALQDAVKKAGG